MSQHRSSSAPQPTPAGALRNLHIAQQHWPGFARVVWWVVLLPAAIAAWASCRRAPGARVAGYALAGFVILVGFASCTGPSAQAPVAAPASPAPIVATTADPVAAAAPAPLVVPPAPSSSVVVAPAPVTTTADPTPVYVPSPSYAGSGGYASSYSSGSGSSSSGSVGYGDTYTNSDGNQVERPDANSSGASARCKDGTFSHSQHKSGTCSGHGGVAH